MCAAFLRQVKILLAYLSVANGLRINKSFPALFFFQEKEMEKQKTLYQQARLHERGAAEMVLQMISASKGDSVILWMGPCGSHRDSML